MKKKIWVFSGCQGSGKTTYANTVQAQLKDLGFDTSRLKFADPLYALHDACLPILKEYGVRPLGMKKDGELLQILGCEYGRKKLGENVWVDAIKSQISMIHYENPDTVVIIDDCRFENEFDALHNDAHMIRLAAPEHVRKARCSYWREDTTHPSETGLDEYDRVNMFHARVETTEHNVEEKVDAILKRWQYK